MTPSSAKCPGRGSITRSGHARCYEHPAQPRTDLFAKGQTMPQNPTHEIRQLPIYRAGLSAGQDIGLRIALDALTAERIRQTLAAANRSERERGPYQFADAALVAVARVLAGRFRQEIS
jgi:hypothetical protein